MTLQQPEMIFSTSSGVAKGISSMKDATMRRPKRHLKSIMNKDYTSEVSKDAHQPFSLDFKPGRSQQVLNIEKDFETQQIGPNAGELHQFLKTGQPTTTQIFQNKPEPRAKSLYEAPNSAKSTISRHESILQKKLEEKEEQLKVLHTNL